MTGLLAFNDGIQRRTSTGTMGLPKSLTRTRSLNAKYDRMLVSTQSVRTGKGSRKILAEVGAQFRLSGEEKKDKVQRDNAEIYRKLGIKMPAKGSTHMDPGVGVMERLERYRLGNIPPPHGNTPPVELDERLRKILYPSPPPPAPQTPTPPPIQLYSEHYYPTGSRVGHRMQAVHPQTPQIDNRYTGKTQAYHLPPPLPVSGGLPPGWVYTPANGWIYIPPAQSYPGSHHEYPSIPPPPPHAQGFPAHLAYPSPYSDVPSSSEGHSSPLKYYRNEALSNTMIAEHHKNSHRTGNEGIDPGETQFYDRRVIHDATNPRLQEVDSSHGPTTAQDYTGPRQQPISHPAKSVNYDAGHRVPTQNTPGQTQSYPKGILRDSSSESSGHGRYVQFRDTPDYAYPEQFRQEAEDNPDPGFCSPPQWKLRKTKAIPRSADRYEQEDTQQVHYPEDGDGDDRQDVGDMDIPGDHTSPLRGRGQDNDGIPAMLASVHQQLLSGHRVSSGVSGKRSGRDLVKSLESMAEMQVERNEEPQEGLAAQNAPNHHPMTPRRRVSIEDRSHFHAHHASEGDQPVSAGRAIPQGRMDDEEDRYEETDIPDNRPVQVPPVRFESDRLRQRDPELRRPIPRPKHIIGLPGLPSIDRPNVQGKSPSPEEGDGVVQQQPEPQTPSHRSQSRNISNNSRLPPPSQNWRESQRPRMTFSQNESMASQDMASQLSNGEVRQDRLTGLGEKKRGRQDWMAAEGEDEYNGEHQFQRRENRPQEVGAQDQEVDQHSYSPHQDFQSDCKNSQSHESSLSQITQELHQDQETQGRRFRLSTARTPRAPFNRHRLTDLQIPLDDDPSDESYRPSQPEEEELEFHYSQTRSISPEEPEAKRIKVTEGAWAKYDIPQDKLPIPKQTHVPFLQAYNKSRFSHHNKDRNQRPTKSKNEVNDENIKSSQTQSQISQIENSDDELDNWMNEDIEESWSQILSDPPERGMKGEKALSTIAEEQEGEEEDEEAIAGVEQVGNDGRRGNVRWVEEGFFGDGGNKGFEIWRDRY